VFDFGVKGEHLQNAAQYIWAARKADHRIGGLASVICNDRWVYLATANKGKTCSPHVYIDVRIYVCDVCMRVCV
jgi:hypothetical protein